MSFGDEVTEKTEPHEKCLLLAWSDLENDLNICYWPDTALFYFYIILHFSASMASVTTGGDLNLKNAFITPFSS